MTHKLSLMISSCICAPSPRGCSADNSGIPQPDNNNAIKPIGRSRKSIFPDFFTTIPTFFSPIFFFLNGVREVCQIVLERNEYDRHDPSREIKEREEKHLRSPLNLSLFFLDFETFQSHVEPVSTKRSHDKHVNDAVMREEE